MSEQLDDLPEGAEPWELNLDPEDLKNPDRSEEGQRRREHSGDDSDPDGREVAEKLYGGLTDSESNDSDE